MLKKICVALFTTVLILLGIPFTDSPLSNTQTNIEKKQWYLCDTVEITDDFRI